MHIAIILPWGARYSPKAGPGAIELSVQTLVAQSTYKRETVIISNAPVLNGVRYPPYDDCAFWEATPGLRIRGDRKRWHGALIQRLNQYCPDLILVEQTAMTARILKRAFPRTPLLLHRHDMMVPETLVKRWRLHHDCRHADWVLCNSDCTKDHHIRTAGCKSERCVTLYNGIDFPDHLPPENKEQLILCVAGMIPRKAAEVFLEAVAPLLPRYPGWSAILVSSTSGNAPSDYRRDIKRRCEALEREGLTYFDAIPYKEVLELYRRAAIAVVPSRCREGFGRTALEAVSSKSALVSSGRGALREISGGFALYPEDHSDGQLSPGHYQTAIERLITEPDMRRHMADQAWRRGRTMFHAGSVAAVYDRILERALNKQ